MYISLNWLQEFVELKEKNPEKICEVLTEKSAEVEDIVIQSKDFENIVVGQITSIMPHTDADSLRVCMVNAGGEEAIQVVCGGSNLEEGQKIALAKLGAKVTWHGEGEKIEMKKTKIRGVESFGMICASDEIGLGDEFPRKIEKEIVDLSHLSCPAGTPLSEALDKNDVIIEVENTSITNRADLFSHVGFARELIACDLATAKPSLEKFSASEISIPKGNGDFPFSISFPQNAQDSIPEYFAVCIDGVNGIKKSPLHIQQKIQAMGLEPKNALVDITNIVMFELGMPVHAFDRDCVPTEWIFDISKGGEKIITLDKEEKTLPQDAIILKDKDGKIFDLCGIQGGKNSGISDTTSKIILHVPIYNPIKIRRTSIAVNHRTDASIIYEKDIPTPNAARGLVRSLDLIAEIFPESTITSEVFHASHSNYIQKNITVAHSAIERVIGINIEKENIITILQNLGFGISEKNKEYEIQIPFFRGDIKITEDIAEEIVRIFGLNSIPAVAPQITIAQRPTTPLRSVEKKVIQALITNGFTEVLTYAFLGEKLLNQTGVEKIEEMITIANPISKDMEIMRSSLTPRLLETAERNIKQSHQFKIFESGKIFKSVEGEKTEIHRITGLLVGYNFFDAKAVGEDIFKTFNISSRIQAHNYNLPFAHPARSAKMTAGKDSSIKVFEIHPKITKLFNLPRNTSLICIDIESFIPLLGKVQKIESISKYPGVDYDISFLTDEEMPVEKLIKNIERTDELINSVKVSDIWRGEGIENGKKSITLSFRFESSEKTLSEKEIKNLEKIVRTEIEKRGATFRFE